MRKLKLLMVAFMAMCGLSVNAADMVVGQKFTSIEELDGKLFAVVDESTSTAMGFGIPNHGNSWDMYFGTYNEAYASNACYLKIEAASEGYCYLHTYNSAGNLYNISWAAGGYFNSQTADKTVCFALGKDQDGANLSVWSIEESEGKFALKNKGTGLYLHADNLPAKYEDAFYFTFCTLIEDPMPAAKEKYNALKNKYLAINVGLDVTEAQYLYDSATTVDDVQAAIDKLVSTFGSSLANETSLTGLITNPSFESGFTGWTNNGMATQNNSSFPGKVGTNYCEAWQPNGTKGVSQTLTLPQGLYRMSANSLARGVTSAKLYAGSKEKAITIADASNTYTFEFHVNGGGDVALGFEGVGTGANTSWLCVDNFQLTYVQNMTAEEYVEYEVLHDALDAYNEAMAAAQALNGKIPAAAYYALSQVVTANTVTDGNATDYNNAAATINAAVANAQPLVAPYATWLTLKEQALTLATGHEKITAAINKVIIYVETLTVMTDLDNANTMTAAMIKNYRAWDVLKKNADALVATSTTDEAARTEVANVRDAQAANISGAATETQEDIATLIYVTIPTATATLKAKMTTYVKTAQPTNDECFDITFLIENAHFYEGEGGNKVATGWTLAEGGWITEHRLATHNFEAWHARFDLSQTITDLPKGTYKVTLQGFARHDDANVTNKTNLYCGIVNQEIKDIKAEWSTTSYYSSEQPAMGDGNRDTKYQKDGVDVYQPNGMTGAYYWFQQENPMTGQPFYTNEVQTLITEPGDLKIGFKCETNTDWVLWDNFHLYYYGSAIAVELDEAAGSSYTEDIDNANVTLKKTIYEGWNTITVPFEATAADFGGGTLYMFTGDENATLKFETATSIEANVPYLLKATTATNGVGEFKFNGVTVKAANELTTAGTNYNFVGTYAGLTVAEGDFILGEDAFYRSAGGNKVKAYRAYIQKKIEETQGARLAIVIDGVTTAIDAIDGKAFDNATIYNLAGQKVEKAQKGIFIQNGKKIVIK